GIVELLRDRLERFLRRNEVDRQVVLLELVGLQSRLDLVGVPVKRLRPSCVVDQVVGRLEPRGDGNAIWHSLELFLLEEISKLFLGDPELGQDLAKQPAADLHRAVNWNR